METKSTSNPEFDAFNNFMDRLLSVPHSEIKKRMERYRKKAAKNPRKRGPKPKHPTT